MSVCACVCVRVCVRVCVCARVCVRACYAHLYTQQVISRLYLDWLFLSCRKKHGSTFAIGKPTNLVHKAHFGSDGTQWSSESNSTELMRLVISVIPQCIVQWNLSIIRSPVCYFSVISVQISE